MSAAAAAVQESIQSFSCPPNIAVEPLALLAITLQDNTEQRLHVICCSIIRTDRWCSGGEVGRGITVCSHILTTDSTSPLSPRAGAAVRDVAVSEQSRKARFGSVTPQHPDKPTSLCHPPLFVPLLPDCSAASQPSSLLCMT